jgi:predicted DNA-binding transcriptional regulator YafY
MYRQVRDLGNMHRITWFDQQVRNSCYPNRGTMAERFEISTRQAQRDIDYIRNSMGAPLKYDAQKKGYYYEDEAYILPSVYISEEQKRMLGFLAYNYENYTQTPKVVQIAQLFKKLNGEEGMENDIPVFDLDKPAVHISYEIFMAARSKNMLQILYRDAFRGDMQIRVHPYKVFRKYRADYMACFSEESGGIEALRLDRILEVKKLGDKFEVRPEFEDRKYSSFVKKEPFVSRIRFLKPPLFESENGIRVRQVEDFIYEVEFYDIQDFINQLVNADYWEIIYSPKWLKTKMKDRCEQILKKLDIR